MVFKKDLEIQKKWANLLGQLKQIVGKRPNDLNNVLYLIGIQELGKGLDEFSKEQKQDLIHIAICRVLSQHGYYELEGLDEEGWPHWKPKKQVPSLDVTEQELLLKISIIEYFEKELNLVL